MKPPNLLSHKTSYDERESFDSFFHFFTKIIKILHTFSVWCYMLEHCGGAETVVQNLKSKQDLLPVRLRGSAVRENVNVEFVRVWGYRSDRVPVEALPETPGLSQGRVSQGGQTGSRVKPLGSIKEQR